PPVRGEGAFIRRVPCLGLLAGEKRGSQSQEEEQKSCPEELEGPFPERLDRRDGRVDGLVDHFKAQALRLEGFQETRTAGRHRQQRGSPGRKEGCEEGG